MPASPFAATLIQRGGKAGRLIAARDWSGTGLGLIEAWPQSLKTALGLILTSPVPIVMLWGVDGIMLYNDAYSTFAGGRHPQLLGSKVREGWPEVADFNDNVMKVVLAGGTLAYQDQELTLNRHGEPEQVWMDLDYSPVLDEGGAPIGVIAIVMETTERVLAQRRQAFLLALEEKIRGLGDAHAVLETATAALGQHLGAMRIGYAEIQPDDIHSVIVGTWQAEGVSSILGRRVRLADVSAESIADYAAGRTVAITDFRTDPLRQGSPCVAAYAAVGVRAQVSVPLVKAGRLAALLFVHSSAPRRWAAAEIALVEDVAERTWGALERARAEFALRELNETLERRMGEALAERKLLADIVDATDVLVMVVGRDFRWLAINRAAARDFQRIFATHPPRIGDNMLDLLADKPEQQAALRALWSRALNGEEFVETTELGNSPRVRRHYEIHFRTLRDRDGQPIGAYQFSYDVTERLREQARLREAETALQQVQKMEAVGRLTGGIAHDFNNLLQGVTGSLDLIRRRPNDSDRVRRLAVAGLHAAERGTKLTGQLLAFSRAQKIEAKPLIVSDLVLGMRDLLQRTLGPLVAIRFELDEERVPVLSDSTQLEMAVLNLVINARDAMPEQGELVIGTTVRHIAYDPELEAGTYVELRVADSGMGMAADVAARAFDPFFTTKAVGKGTGLGLSQVYGIARQSGGTARIESRIGAGTTVRLFLRSTEQGLSTSPVTALDEVADGRHATVLVIDDDDDVREFLVTSLETLGHQVAAASDGQSGLAMLDGFRPEVMVVDFAMPGMSGADVARAARQWRSDLPVIFASGYSDTAAIERIGRHRTMVLRKPFRVDELAAAITDVMAA